MRRTRIHLSGRPRARRWAAVLAATAVAGLSAGPGWAATTPRPTPAELQYAAGQPVMTIDKTVRDAPDPLVPGSTFTYHLTLSCSSLRDSCQDVVLSDTLPAEFDVDTLPASTPTREVDYDPATRKLTVTFKTPLPSPPNPAGSTGIPAGGTQDVDVVMKVPDSGSLKNGQTVNNTATASAANADTVLDSASVTVTIPKYADAGGTKSWSPAANVATLGGTSTVTLGAANLSSGSTRISPLAIEENSVAMFDDFDLTGIGPVRRMPAGADRVTVLVCTKPIGSPCSAAEYIAAPAVPGPDLALPAGVSPGQVTGVKFEFSNAAGTPLPYDATGASVPIEVKLRNTVRSTGAPLNPPTRQTIRNCAAPSVKDIASGFTILGEEACATHDILPNVATVDVAKRFYSDANGDFSQNGNAVVGQHSGVTANVTAKNTSPFPVQTLTITEPSDSTAAQFDAVDAKTVRLTFPTGATSAELSVTCGDGTVLPVRTFTAAATVPAGCPAGSPPKRISVTYKGNIAQGATGALAVHGNLNGKETSAGVRDCADASATNPSDGSGTAAGLTCATLPMQEPNSSGHGSKTSSQSEIPPGQPVWFTVDYNNTGNVLQPNVVLTDPADPTAAGNPFDLVQISDVQVVTSPTTLPVTIELFDPTTKAWVRYVRGDTALPAIARGVRFVAANGVPPGGRITGHILVTLRDGVEPGQNVHNCFSTSVDSKVTDNRCTDVATGPARAGASLTKSLSPATVSRPVPGVAPQTVNARLTVVNTGNVSLKQLVLTDADPAFFDAMTLTGITGVTFPPGANQVQVDACAVCGANPTWVLGSPTTSTTPSLPSGVSAADVQGLRVTFTSTSGGYDIVPQTSAPNGGQCPMSSFCFTAQPRDGLRSDPGTPIPDTVSDTVTGAGESRLQNPGQTFPIPPGSATVNVVTGTHRLKVDKEPPDQTVSPGNPASFQLVTTNTGTAPIQDLSIADAIPNGLVFDDTFAGTDGYPFTISYTGPTGPASPMPSQVSFQPARDAGGKIVGLTWKFPGFTFYPTAQITLGFQVKLAGGIAAGTRITNKYAAGSDTQEGITCDPSSPRLTVLSNNPALGPGTFCQSQADVVARPGASFDAAKWVAGDPALGFQDSFTGATYPVGDARCPSLVYQGTTYTRYPCIALTKPGQNFEYLISVTNQGTEPAGAMSVLDVFPAPGDTGVLLGDQDRGTTWDTVPQLVGPVTYDGPGQATITYSATANPCGQRIATPQRPCHATSWNPAPPGHPTGFEAGVAYAPGLAPGATVTFRMTFQAPADLSTPAFPAPAWNSFAHTETVSTGALPVTEPPKAGIGLVFGNVKVAKLVNDPPDVPFGPFTVDYSCSLTTAGGVTQEVRTGRESLTEAQPLSLTGIPAGAVCRIWESDAAGAVTDHGPGNPLVVTVAVAAGADQVQRFEITNQFPRRDLVVWKRVTGPAADEVGQGPFTVTVDCSFRGNRLPGFPKDLTFTGNGSQALTGLPIGSKCDVEETDAGGATSHEEFVTSTERATVVTSRTGSKRDEPTSDTPAQVVVANSFEQGGLLIVKKLEGPGAAPASRRFGFHVLCDFNGRKAVVARDVEMGPPDFLVTVPDLPVGAVCTVTETDAGGADAPAAPVGPLTIEQGAANVVSATLTNVFSAGHLTLVKRLAGAGAAAAEADGFAYPLHVLCTVDGGVGAYALDAVYRVKADEPFAVPAPIPVGARCWVGEVDRQGAESVHIDHGSAADAAVVSGPGAGITITATNTFTEAPEPGTGTGTHGGKGRPMLPGTGVGAGVWMSAWLAFGLLAVGAALVWGRRRGGVGDGMR
ncbi:hypothetical protein KGQ20_37990 [Catenulispora sp. NF23]|uniref:DUF5979 domain-containing protein n=1 Tax=Catenulispora pinistramenti TaxID=2705254 RepID=A0ABS5L3F0_9ACTN|nr:DUF5979 domain-containing protein [Catenulispora pinistramenti]MBS2538553.1 hypothetical protein [Catenulispora pinistramenti]MBS2552878.1 hypothetical protein [Catenulispora pinistramenti]